MEDIAANFYTSHILFVAVVRYGGASEKKET